MLGRFRICPGNRADLSPYIPDGSRKARREGFLLSTLLRRQRKALRSALHKSLQVVMVAWLALFASPNTHASFFIDDAAILTANSGAWMSNADIVTLMLQVTFLRYDAAAVPNTVVSPVTLDGGTSTLPGPTDGEGSPLLGSISNPVTTTLPLVPAGAVPVYADGEAVFFSAQYPWLANDPLVAERARLRVRIYSDAILIDEETLEIYETGIATGLFTGYFQNAPLAGGPGDGLLMLPPGAHIELVDAVDLDDGVIETQVVADVGNAAGDHALFVTKRAQRETAAIGDFLQYQVDVANTVAYTATGITVSDVLPPGFRYMPGSATRDGVAVADPAISPDGATLAFAAGDLATAQHASLRYVVTVTGGARPGRAINSASARSTNFADSNIARASVRVTEDLFRSAAIVVGRVLAEDCRAQTDALPEATVDGQNPIAPGVAGVRLYLEDGTTVVTDTRGRYHVAGLKPGTHVVQIDLNSLPTGYEPVSCYDNTRFAHNTFSQFIDVQGGGLWRADFHLRKKTVAEDAANDAAPPAATPAPAPAATADGAISLQLTSTADYGIIRYRAELKTGATPLHDVQLMIRLPDDLQVMKGSLRRDGNDTAMVRDNDVRRITIGNVESSLDTVIEFDAIAISDDISGEMATEAWVSVTGDALITPPARNVAVIGQRAGGDTVNITVSTNFPPMGATLTVLDQLKLDDVVDQLRVLTDPQLTVTGYTDSTTMPKNNKKLPYKDNAELSQARAATVAEYLRKHLDLAPEAVTVVGAGADKPIASNKTQAGRAKNRRVAVSAHSRTFEQSAEITLPIADSGAIQMTVPAGPAAAATDADASATPTATPAAAAAAAAARTAEPAPETAATDAVQPGFLDYVDGQHIAQRIQQVRLAVDSRLTPHLRVDGIEVSEKRIGYRSVDHASNMALYSYIGVDIGERGEHTLQLTGTDSFGNVRLDKSVQVIRTGEIHDLRLVAADGNIADGKTPVLLKVELLDEQRQVINAGATLQLLEGNLQPEDINSPLDPLERSGKTVQVNPDGSIRFKPVTQSGRYHLRIAWAENRSADFTLFVKPDFRDWILVGLAEGSTAYRTISGNMQALPPGERDEGFGSDGRVSFFAKGRVRGDWLLTLAYDTKKSRANGLTDDIDPNAWYTLYGDAATQDQDAASQRKLYLKIERENFYALFGDFDTGLNVTELSRYQRRLNGVKSEYWGNRIETLAFASQTRQAFVRDELRGDGTSGLYHLRHTAIVPNSDTITIEVRDRFRSELVLSTKTLTRFLDYSLDYDTGEIWFKEPILGQDDAFNPVYIVAGYEIDNGVEDTTAGVRVAGSPRNGMKLGVTGVREGLGNGSATLAGADLTIDINARNKLTAEIAGTGNSQAATTPVPTTGASGDGAAWVLKHEYKSEKVAAESYVRTSETGFGLGQQSTTEAGTTKIGTDVRYNLSDTVKIDGQLYRQEQLDKDRTRDLAEVRATLDRKERSYFGGVRLVEDAGDTTLGDRSSQQLIGGARQRLLGDKLELKVEAETNVGEQQSSSVDFPHRFRTGADYRIDNRTSVFGEQEWGWGDGQDSQHTRAGLRHSPWKGGQLSSSVGRELNENGPRVYANAGLVQNWIIDGHWTADAGFDRAQTLADPGTPAFDPAVAPTNGDSTEDYTALFAGAAYQDGNWRWRSRAETRNGKSSDKLNLYSSVYRELDDADTIGGSLRLLQSETNGGNIDTSTTLQFDYAHRPLAGRWIVLDQFQYVIDRREDATDTLAGRRFVNNLNANWQYDERNQLGLQYGAKYVFDTIDNRRYTGYTDVMGIEYRHDLTSEWDIGARTSLLHSWSADAVDESYGVFVGWSPEKNIWLSLGYNIKGFRDNDFAGADYRDQGFNLALRIKVDQNSIKEMARGGSGGSMPAPRSDY